MVFEIREGLLTNARYVPSTHFNERPIGTDIDLLVIHNISLPPGEFGGPYIDAFFSNTLDPSLHPYFQEIITQKVSSHCLITRAGEITQYVPFTQRAWHAGLSSFAGRADCNDYSIGIELEGTDEIPYTDAQYKSLTDLIRVLIKVYPKITWERIVGHSTIAPGRKTDPGDAFDWGLLAKLLNRESFHETG